MQKATAQREELLGAQRSPSVLTHHSEAFWGNAALGSIPLPGWREQHSRRVWRHRHPQLSLPAVPCPTPGQLLRGLAGLGSGTISPIAPGAGSPPAFSQPWLNCSICDAQLPPFPSCRYFLSEENDRARQWRESKTTAVASTWACLLLMFVFLLFLPPGPGLTFLLSGLTSSIHFSVLLKRPTRSTTKIQHTPTSPASSRKQLPMEHSCLEQVTCFPCKTATQLPLLHSHLQVLLKLSQALIWGISHMLNIK